MLNTQTSFTWNVREIYLKIREKADKMHRKLSCMAYHENRISYETYFNKVLSYHTQLLNYQDENMQKLITEGIERCDLGDIASRVAQFNFEHYLRSGKFGYLEASCNAYGAALALDYYRDAYLKGDDRAFDHIVLIARYLIASVVSGRRDRASELRYKLNTDLSYLKNLYPARDYREIDSAVEEITNFMTNGPLFLNECRMRYNTRSNPSLDGLPVVDLQTRLKLTDAILLNFDPSLPNTISFMYELSPDNYRMLQSLEWEPEISSENPKKALVRPSSVKKILWILSVICKELPQDGIALVYISARDQAAASISPGRSTNTVPGDHSKGLYIGSEDNGAIKAIYPADIIPFMRSPIFLIIDSRKSHVFEELAMQANGYTVAMLLSPAYSSNKHDKRFGSEFTMFLTAPVQAFLKCTSWQEPDIPIDKLVKAEEVLFYAFKNWGDTLAQAPAYPSPDSLHPAWGRVLGDPFLRRFILRFIFHRALFTLAIRTSDREKYLPKCSPDLPSSMSPTNDACKNPVIALADIFGVTFPGEPVQESEPSSV